MDVEEHPNLAEELGSLGFKVSPQKVGRLLHANGCSPQSTNKTLEGTTHPDRNGEFEFTNDGVDTFHARGAPVGCTGNGPGLGKLYERVQIIEQGGLPKYS